jgi:hypothetical protein
MRSQPISVAANPAAAKIDWLLISGVIACRLSLYERAR